MNDNRITFPVKSHGYAGEPSPRERGDGAYGIKGVSIDFKGEPDKSTRGVWAVILSATVAVVVLFLALDASRSPLYAAQHAEVTDVR